MLLLLQWRRGQDLGPGRGHLVKFVCVACRFHRSVVSFFCLFVCFHFAGLSIECLALDRFGPGRGHLHRLGAEAREAGDLIVVQYSIVQYSTVQYSSV